jgi:glutamyl-tRNA reductase
MFVDISVPRNVHADCSTVAGALCYNVDHLKAVVQRNTNKRKREMLEAESILKEEQNKFRVSLLLSVLSVSELRCMFGARAQL